MSEWTLDTLKELFEARFAAIDTATTIHTKELARRLDILNHAHERAVEVQHTYVPRELFEAFEHVFEEYKSQTNRALVLREGQARGIGMSAGALVGALTAVAAVISVVIVLANVLTGH